MTAWDKVILLGHFEVASSEWHAARAKGYGGSEIAAIVGLSPYESRFSLWHRKAGMVGPQEQNDEMEWGKRLEPAICQKFADSHPELVVAQAGTYANAERPWQIANPDRLLSTLPDGPPLAILETKFALYPDGWGDAGTDEIPVYYRAQVLHYLDVFGLDLCHVAVLIGGHDYREYEIHAATEEQTYLRAEGRAFLDSIAAGERPDIDQHAETYVVVRELHPDIHPVDVEVPDALAVSYLAAVRACKDAEDIKQEQTSLVATVVGDGRRAMFAGKSIAVRVPGRGGKPPYLKAQPLPKAITTNVQKAA